MSRGRGAGGGGRGGHFASFSNAPAMGKSFPVDYGIHMERHGATTSEPPTAPRGEKHRRHDGFVRNPHRGKGPKTASASRTPNRNGHLACSSCHRYYETTKRLPMTLHCHHVICDECLAARLSTNGGKVTCQECHEDSFAPHLYGVTLRADIAAHFPVNYYIVGKLVVEPLLERRNGYTTNFVRERTNSSNDVVLPKRSSNDDVSLKRANPSKDCSRKYAGCGIRATIRCAECNTIFCKFCCAIAHNTTEEDGKHNMFSIANVIFEAQPKDTSETSVFRAMGNVDPEEFHSLLRASRGILRKLEATRAAVAERITKFKPRQANAAIERTILKCFAGLHAKLQRIENALMQSMGTIAEKELVSLQNIEVELAGYIQNVAAVIDQAEDFVKKSRRSMEAAANCNSEETLRQMQHLQNIPHSLQIEKLRNVACAENLRFEYIPFADDWEQHFKLNAPVHEYKLTSEEEAHETSDESMDCSPHVSQVTIGDKIAQSILVSFGDQEKALKRHAMVTMPTDSKSTKNDVCNALANVLYIELKKQLQTPGLTIGSMINVIITHIISPCSIFVQLTKYYKSLHTLHDQLQLEADLQDMPSPELGNMYLVKYLLIEPPQWRRGVILSVNSSNRDCEVNLVDFGNSIKSKWENLRSIRAEIHDIPPFALECRLHNLQEPMTSPWNDHDAKFMATVISGFNITMCVHDLYQSFTPEVDFKISSPDYEFSMRDCLIFLGRGAHTHLPDDEDDLVFERSPSPTSLPPAQCFSSMSLEQSRKETVYITNVVNAVTVFVQIVSSTDLYIQLKASMTKFYMRDTDSGRIYAPKVGMLIAVQHCLDASRPYWHRGVVTIVNNGQGTVQVRLVDCGNLLTVPGDDIRILAKQFRALQMLATQTKLAHISLSSEEENAMCVAMLKSLAWKPLKMVVHDVSIDTPEIILFEESSDKDVCINSKLVKKGMISTGFLSTIVEWCDDLTGPSSSLSDTRPPVTFNLMRQCQGTDDGDNSNDLDSEDESEGLQLESVKVLSVIDPHCIYIQKRDEDFQRNLTQFELNLQKYYSCNFLNTRPVWKIGEVAIAYDRAQKQFFRVNIHKLPTSFSQEEYQVIGQDFGNVFKAPLEAIGELADEFSAIPPLGLRVKLYGIKPFSAWSLTVTDFLAEMIQGKKNVFITVVRDEALEVVLWCRHVQQGGALERHLVKMINVNKTLCKNGLAILSKDWNLSAVKREPAPRPKAIKTKAWLPAEPFSSNVLEGIASNINDDGDIYFAEMADQPTLQKMEDAMAVKYMDYIPDVVSDWQVGESCIAKYHLNQKWYRCEVVSVDVHEIGVRMIDFGNVEKVKYHDISRELVFDDVPRIAKLVRLDNVPAIGSSYRIELLDQLHAFVVENNISVTIRKGAQNDSPARAFVECKDVNVNKFMTNQINAREMLASSSETASVEEVVIVQSKFTYSPLPRMDQFEIEIVNCMERNKIVFQLARSSDDLEFSKLSADINMHWFKQPILSVPIENQICIAQYAVDNKWYRAEIFKLDDGFYVYFVDYGNYEKLRECEIRKIHPEWVKCTVKLHIAQVPQSNLNTAVKLVKGNNKNILAKVIRRQPLTLELSDS